MTAFSIEGKRFLITGATGGIGSAIALGFARAGASILANYGHREEPAHALATEAAREGLDIQLIRADITSLEGRGRLVTAVGERGLDGIVHSAATGIHRPIEQLSDRHFDFTFAVNVKALLGLVQQLLPVLARGSAIVALSSEGAARAVPSYTLVGATKGALESMCRHLAVELAPRGIRVNVLSPGAVRTPAWDALPDHASRLEDATRRSPTGRLTTAEDVALAAHFLCSEAARGVNGQVLIVDNGTSVSAFPVRASGDRGAS